MALRLDKEISFLFNYDFILCFPGRVEQTEGWPCVFLSIVLLPRTLNIPLTVCKPYVAIINYFNCRAEGLK